MNCLQETDINLKANIAKVTSIRFKEKARGLTRALLNFCEGNVTKILL